MKHLNFLFILAFALAMTTFLASCGDDDKKEIPDPSTTELLVTELDEAPDMDGDIDGLWKYVQKLEGTTEVPDLAARGTWLYSDGEGVEENLGLFAPFSGDTQDFTMRAGYFGDDIYFLLEWDDDDDSKDRQSWYFDDGAKKWTQEHKYANALNDKFYEDKFAFLFPIGDVAGFNSATCYATCHQNLALEKDKDKHTRHYLTGQNDVVDMWHWKRVRGTYNDKVDDQRMVYAEATGSSANGRGGDEGDGQSGYSDNKQTLTITGTSDDVSVPKYIIPGQTNYFWIGENELGSTAKLITAVDADGVLTYDGGTIDPANGGFEQGVGNMRVPSVTTRDFLGNRADISIKTKFTGSGWVAELKRKLNTGDPQDVVFSVGQELAFGFATFDNAAIAHAIKPGLVLKVE